MAVDVANVSGLLKQIYDDREIENLQNMEPRFYNKIKKSPKKPSGQGFFTPINVQGNQEGQGSQNELEALRDPGNQVPLQWRILPKVFTHTIRYSGLSLEIAKGDEDSFADNATFQMDEGLKDSFKELNQQCFRDGSGIIAQVNGAQILGSTTIVVDNGVITHFRLGEVIDIVAAGPILEATTRVRAIDISTNTLTVDPLPAAISDDSFIYRQSVWNNAPVDGKELAGLPLITDDGTLSALYQGLDRTVFQALQGITLSAGGANLSNDLLERAISRVKTISNGKNPKNIVSNTQQFRKYLDVVTPQKRFGAKDKYDSGYEEVPTWNGKEWIVDTDCGFNELYILSMEYIEKYEVYALRFDSTGEGVLKWDNGFDAYISYAKSYMNLGCRVPNASVRITNLAIPLF